jgi:aryl-alcohol dehydrogenase-like predicted oxidoreductase
MAHALDSYVKRGKILYLGVSDTPAWIVSQFNQYAKDHGLTPFSVYQGRWSASDRDFEREIIPMARHLGLALCPWGALGGGKYKTEQQIEDMKKRSEQGRVPFTPPSDADRAITKALDKIAKTKGEGIGVTGIAMAYVMHKAPDVHPIVGGRKIEHLKENIAALTVRLSPEEIKEIEEAGGKFQVGFPHNFLGQGEKSVSGPGEVAMLNRSGNFDFHPPKGPIIPKQK